MFFQPLPHCPQSANFKKDLKNKMHGMPQMQMPLAT
jgi:hypothetical protein